jgi:tetratricopeptide (TPR) repeat protein
LAEPVLARSPDRNAPVPPESIIPPQAIPDPDAMRRQELDALFTRLKQAKGAAEARPIEAAIRAALADGASPTVELLMWRGETLLQNGDLKNALSLYSAITEIRPGFAAGWTKRGAVQFLVGQFAAAQDDFRRALALEPRDLDALRDLGAVLEQAGDHKGALEAYRQALALDPNLDNVAERAQRLEETIRGRGI